MNTRQVFTAAAFALISTGSFAQSVTSLEAEAAFFAGPKASSPTRAEVSAEVIRAVQAGELPYSGMVDASAWLATLPASKRTRAEVIAETKAAQIDRSLERNTHPR